MHLFSFYLVYAIALTIALALGGRRGRAPVATGAARPPLKRVLIVGATGGTGRELVRQALARDCAVTAFVRDPARLAIAHPQLRVVQGDVLDAAAVAAAMAGQEAVLCALGHKRYYTAPRLLSAGTANLLGAMARQGVRRIVCETSLGLGDSAGRLGLIYTLIVIPLVLPLYFWDKTRQERLLAASDRDWVIVRPGALTNDAQRGGFKHGAGVGSFLGTVRVARADVAAFMLDQLGDDRYLRAAPGLCD